MPSMISFSRSTEMEKGAVCGASARVTGCSAAPRCKFASSARHHASFAAAT
jgi:hypothetical protein